jgi:iduronate 2-sulfatase
MRLSSAWSLLFLVACAAGAPAAEKSKLNVLFITADDLNVDLGCYGHPLVKTPNLDRLASRGVRFDRAYCQYALCNPSRSSLMTGRRPDSIRVLNNGAFFRDTMPDVITLPQLFRQQGWFSARAGKIFHAGVPMDIGTDGRDDPLAWDFKVNPRGRDKDQEDALVNYSPKRSLGSCLCYEAAEGTSEEQTDGKIASEIIKLLEQKREKPFLLGVGFYRPHSPHIAPRKFFDLYPLDKIPAPKSPPGDLKGVPQEAFFIKPPNWGATEQQQREVIRGYYATVSFLDEQVGRVLDALDRLELADSTIVVFFGDNGYLLGEHGQWMKTMLFEPAARVPFIMAGPGIAKGKPCPRTVELLDLYPTLTDLCGLTPPPGLEGRNLRPLLSNPDAPWPYPAYTQVLRLDDKRRPAGHSVRTERWRYTEWEQGKTGVELYDEIADPGEFNNLAHDAKCTNIVAELRVLLRQVQK